MTDFVQVPLKGKELREGKRLEFDNIEDARQLATGEKKNWDIVCVYLRRDRGESEVVEHYLRGTKNVPAERET